MRATEKTLYALLEEVNELRSKVGLCPLFFLKVTKNLKLQNRYTYQLYALPKNDEKHIKALRSTQSANCLRLYLAGLLDGAEIGMKIAAIINEVKNQEVINGSKTD